VRKPKSGIASQSGFVCSTNSKNIGRPLKSVRWRTLKSGTCKSAGFGIPRGIDERVHFDFKDMASRLEMRGLDLTRGRVETCEVCVKKNGKVWSLASDVIRHGGEGGGLMREDIEFSHSHRA
jgi:hypothetical protein